MTTASTSLNADMTDREVVAESCWVNRGVVWKKGLRLCGRWACWPGFPYLGNNASPWLIVLILEMVDLAAGLSLFWCPAACLLFRGIRQIAVIGHDREGSEIDGLSVVPKPFGIE